MLHGLACHAGVRSPGLVSSPPGSSQIDPVPGSTRGGSYKAEPACAWRHHPFLRAADSLGLPSTGSSQPQSPDRGLAGQLLRHSVCRQPAPQPGTSAPESMATDVETACTGACGLESCVADHLEAMCTRLQ